MRRFVLVVVSAVLCCRGAAAAKFLKVDGTTIAGDLQSVDAKGVMTVRPEKGGVVRVPSDELMRVEFGEGREAEEPVDGVLLYLPGGDRICGALKRSSKASLEVESQSLGRATLSLEKLLALEFRRAGEAPNTAAKMRAQMLGNQTKNDISFSANGDQMPGIMVGFDGATVLLKTGLGEIPLKCSRLFGVSFAARKRPPPPPSLLAVARCTDGTVATGRLMVSKDGRVRLALLAGPEVRIAAGHLVELGFKHGKLVYLSELEPAKAVYRPYFGGDRTWPYQRDRTYDRKPIRLAGKPYRKGLGMFSGTTLTYRLGGEFAKFVSLVGIDDADVNHHGNVTVRVLADGKKVFEKTELTRRSGPAKVSLSMDGVRELQLVVDFGKNMLFGDLTDWANARLIR